MPSINLLTPIASRERIFISYRRSDTRGYAGRLDDSLKAYFGKDRVFRDVGSIDAGEDFVQEIHSAMGESGALIVLIGANWLAPAEGGKPRLYTPGDYVAAEIEAALVGKRPIFPVLVEGASMPREDELPAQLKGLARRNAVTLSDERWGFDVTRLAKVVALDIAGSIVERRLDLLKLAVLSLLFVTIATTTLLFARATYCVTTSEPGEQAMTYWHAKLCPLSAATPSSKSLNLHERFEHFFSPGLASANFVGLLIAILALVAARTWVEPGRRRFLWATVFLGAAGTLVCFIFYNVKGDEEPVLAVSAMFAASSLIIGAMFVLMTMSGFKPNDSVT